MVVGNVCINITTPPFVDLLVGTYCYSHLITPGYIGFFDECFIRSFILFQYLLNDISCFGIIQSCGQKSTISMCEFNIMAELGAEIGISLLKSITVQEV